MRLGLHHLSLRLEFLMTAMKRDGDAEYVCQVLYDHGFKGKGVLVSVIDIKTSPNR